MKLDIWVFFEYTYLLRKLKFSYSLTKIMGTLHEDLYTFMIISSWITLKWRDVWDRSCKENQYTHFLFNIFFESRATYGIMWKNVIEAHGLEMTHTHKHTHTNTLYIYIYIYILGLLITLPLQHWLRRHTSMLRWYVHCLSCVVDMIAL